MLKAALPSFLMLMASSNALAQGFASDLALYEWMMGYYADPQPARVPAAVHYFASSELSNTPKQREPLMAFFGAVFDESEEAQRKALEASLETGNRRMQWVVATALWLGQDEDAPEAMEDLKARTKDDWIPQLITELEAQPNPIGRDQALSQPGQIDLLWARFFATGSIEPVRRIAEQVRWIEGNDIPGALGKAARWSLAVNARQHTRVLEFVRQLAAEEDHEIGRATLEEIVHETETALRGETGDGDAKPDSGQDGSSEG